MRGFRRMKPVCRNVIAVALLVWALLYPPGKTGAEVFHSRESALRLAFPDAERVEKRELFLSEDDADAVSALSGTSPRSRMITVYAGTRDSRIVGYAFIETHKVRSLPETVLLVVYPDGRLRSIHLLAFHEPPEYAPTQRWLDQFTDRRLEKSLSLRGNIDGISGATLTANAITASVRKILAVFEVALGSEAAAGPGNGGEIMSD